MFLYLLPMMSSLTNLVSHILLRLAADRWGTWEHIGTFMSGQCYVNDSQALMGTALTWQGNAVAAMIALRSEEATFTDN